ncbi:hypothetical protein Tco_0509122, partial [Tanacetum coccineum]
MEMVARKIQAKKGGKKKTIPKADKPAKPAPGKQPKPVKEKISKPYPTKQSLKGKVAKVQNGKSPLKLVDEDEEVHHEPEPQGKGDDPNLTRAIQMSLASFQEQGQAPIGGVAIREPFSDTIQKLPVVEGKGKGIATDEQATESLLDLHKPKKKSIADQYIFQRRTPVSQATATGPSAHPEHDTSANIIRDTPSPADAETKVDTDITNSTTNTEVLYAEDVQGEEISHTVVLEEKTAELDEGHAGSDPGKTLESRPPPEHEHIDEDQVGPSPGQSHAALVGSNPEPMHDDFIATVYPKVHESLKHMMEKHIHLESPLSSSGTLSSMKNLDDTFTFDDQLLSDKPTEEEPGKATVETEAESMVTVPIHQASTSVPPLSTPIIDLSPPKPVSSPLQEPFIAATTTTLPLPPPSLPQSFEVTELASRVSVVEKINAELEQKILNQDKKINALGSRVYTLENHELYLKIDNLVNEVVSESVHDALKAPLLDHFRELSKIEMKELLHDQMFESRSYKSHSVHVALYEALEVSMNRDNREEFLANKDKSCKRRRDDQDRVPSPPKDSNQNKKKSHDSDASGSQQPQASTSVQIINEDPIPDDTHLSDSEDIAAAHLLKIKTRPDWLKPIPKEDTPLEECHRLLTDKIDLVNPEGHQIVPDISKPLPLGGLPGQPMVSHTSGLNERKSTSLDIVPPQIIVLRRADYNEYKISKADFKNLHPNDFE